LEANTRLAAERHAEIQQQLGELQSQRDALGAERDALCADRETFCAEREAFEAARAAFESQPGPLHAEGLPPGESSPPDESRELPADNEVSHNVNVTNVWRRPEELSAELAQEEESIERLVVEADEGEPVERLVVEAEEAERIERQVVEAEEVAFQSPETSTPVSAHDVLSRLGHGDMFHDAAEAASEEPAPAWRSPADDESRQSHPVAAAPVRSNADDWSGGSEKSPAASEEESIEDYMARLLQRVRGDDQPASAGARRTEPAYVPPPRVTSTASTLPKETKQISINVVESDDKPSDFLPRSQAPELSSNLKAMRELANESARTAIHTSARKRGGASAASKFFVAGVAIALGVVLLLVARSLGNLALCGAAALLVIGLLFGLRGVLAVRRAVLYSRQQRTPAPGQPAEQAAPAEATDAS
jgi:hypothetical protein